MRLSGPPERQRQQLADAVDELEETVDRLEAHSTPDATDAAAELINLHNLDPSKIVGTGEDGRILKGDVTTYLEGVDLESDDEGDGEE